MKLKVVLGIVAGGAVVLFVLTRLSLFSGRRPESLGVDDAGKLAPCPESPNCVSTQASDAEHGMEPIPYTGSEAEARAAVRAVVEGMPRTRIITDEPGYLYAEFSTGIMRFTDDVEFAFDDEAGLIHFRSASRLGYSDMGLNRRRMTTVSERIRSRL